MSSNAAGTQNTVNQNGINEDIHNAENAIEQETGIWNSVHTLHGKIGFIYLISQTWRYIPNWAEKMYRRISNRPKERLPDKSFGFRTHFADMNQMYMRQLHAKLIAIATSLHFEKDQQEWNTVARSLGPTLRMYVQAVQDHEYMTKYSSQRYDPFIASSERLHDKYFLNKELNRIGATPSELEELKPFAPAAGPWEIETNGRGAQPLLSTRMAAVKKALWSRVGGALVGGAFLIGPMWGLVLKREVYFHLGLTTGCVFVFGLLIAWYLKNLEAVFTATLAYAAVLMVFVGVSMQSLDDFNGAGGT